MYYYLKNVLMYLHSTVLCRENGVLHYYYHQICKEAPLWTKGTDRIPNHSTDLSAVGTRKGNIFKREGRKRVANRMPREAVRQRHHKSHPSIHPGAGGRCVRRAAPCSASSAHNSPHARTRRRRRRSRFSFFFFFLTRGARALAGVGLSESNGIVSPRISYTTATTTSSVHVSIVSLWKSHLLASL